MYAFRTLYRLAVAKKVKINYFVVDARTGRGIDRSLDRIKSRATRLPFPRVFLSYFFFFFLPPPLPPFFLIFLIFIFIAADTNAASVLFFPDTVDDTQRKMITLFVVAKEWRKRGEWIGYLADKVLLSMPPRGKGIYLDVEEKESKAFRRFSGKVG